MGEEERAAHHIPNRSPLIHHHLQTPPPMAKGTAKGKNKAKSNSSMPPPNTSLNSFCGFCKAEGKPSNHSGADCEQWKTLIAKFGQVCRVCQRAGRPSDHEFRTCPHKAAEGKGKGGWFRSNSPKSRAPSSETNKEQPVRTSSPPSALPHSETSVSSNSTLPGSSGPR